MALLGMQADMQYKSFFPGHYSTMDLNLDANGSIWPLNNIDKIFMNGHDYNGALLLPSPHQHLVQNKDTLKQAMLKHEAIFKDQIRELHRLYWRQRELMDEMKTKLLKHHLQLETLLSNPLLSQNSCDYAQKTCHVYSLPQMNPACDRSSVLTAENNLPLSCFKEGNSMCAGPEPAQTKFSLKGCELESKCKKFGKKILDLELPPYEYIDSEEEECLPKATMVLDYPPKSNQQPYHGIGSFNSAFQGDNLTPSSISVKKICLADLNEPIKPEEEVDSTSMYVADLNEPTKHEEEAAPRFKFLADLNEPIKPAEDAASVSSDFPSSAGNKEFPCLDLSQKSNSGLQVFSTELMQITKKGSDLETCSEGLHLETNKKEKWPSSDNEAGQSGSDSISLAPGFGVERSMSLEDAELKLTEGQSGSDSMSLPPGFGGEISMSLEDAELKQTQEFPRSGLMDQSEKKSCSEGSESLRREVSSNSFPGTDTCQLISLADVGNSEASSVSSWRKHVHDIMRTPIAVQALPCFNTSAPLRKRSKSSAASPWLTGQKSNTPLISFDGPDCNNDDLASKHHFPTKFISLSVEVKPAMDVNSNSVSHNCSSDREKKLEDLTRGLPWLKTNSICKRKRGKRSELSTRVESVLERANLSCIHDVELKKVDASNNSSDKAVRGFQKIYNKPPHVSNGHSSSHQYPSEDEYIMTKENIRVTDINVDSDPVTESKIQLFLSKDVAGGGLHKRTSDFGVTIDLNSSIDEHDYSPALTLSTEMDLEAPVSPENKERSPPRGESDENHVGTPFRFSGKEDEDVQMDLVGNAVTAIVSGQERGAVLDELVGTAAKAIVSISSSTVQTCSETAACEPFEPCWSDELYWFAGVASLVVDDPDCEFGVALSCKNSQDNDEFLSDGLDYFEAMTLKLTETKVEEQWVNKSNDQKDHKEEETVDTFLMSQTRRGRMRRRRQQQQDFQSEILPSLASLSRYEVTEDLQTIEGLIEAANYTWGTCSTRNMGRTSRARGRRRTGISTSNLTEISCLEKGVEEGKLIGWGKITRRRRGPRCPASNPRLIQGQVH
ncbi:uncharacterized protein LOC116107754 isoform X1 [Pistacia vera]|uniref:uncharacterized protein LOC116107754 isoform X1 n=1 Tax=Pistacia vera TaxID=55513 RepID=UPI001262C159|nr:uncharacterized protein LOC116107754 isoform X1 [Pistacia vera]